MNRSTFLSALFGSTLIGGGALWINSTAWSEQIPGVVKAREIVLVDRDGRPRIVLAVNPQTGAAAIQVLDAMSGRPRIIMGTDDDQSSRIELHDVDGAKRADFVQMGSTVRLSLADSALKGGVVLGSGADGKVMMVFNDSSPTHRLTLGIDENKDGNLAIYDDKGTPTYTAVPASHP